MGDVVSTILVTNLVETLINTINEKNSIAEKPDSKDVEESMAKLSKESTKLEKVVTDQKEQIKNNTIQISKFYENPKKTYDRIEDISHFVESQLNITDIAFRRVDRHLDTALDDIQYSQDMIISRIEVLLSEARQEKRYLEAKEKISNLKLILSDFYSKTIELNKLSIPERIEKLESQNDILLYLEDSRVPKQSTLYSLLSYLIKRKFAIPQNQDDQLSLAMLQLLCSGVQTYVYMLGFALQQYALLSDHYYRKNNVDKYNHYYMRGVNTLVDFSNTLTGRIGLLDKVASVLQTVGKLDFIQGSRKDVTELMRSKMNRFWAIQNSLESSKKLFQFDIPNKLNPNLDFSLSNISIPIADWKSGAKVSYAVHLLGNSTLVPFTMISPWSTGYTLDLLANPAVPIYLDQLGRSRVIFRQIDNGTPQIVATINDSVQQLFRDIDRDLFNAARELNDEDVALKNIQIYIENNANVNAAFANSQRAIHAAAENNKWKIARELIKHGADINAIDDDGYSPLHIATELGHGEFVEELLKLSADVNIALSERKHKLTPLHTAVYKGHVEIVKKLLRVSSIDINAQTTDGFSPLHYATFYNNEEIVALIFKDNQITFDVKSNRIEFPLSLSTNVTFDEQAESLVHSGNVAPLHLASAFGNKNVLNELLQKSSDIIKTKTNDGSTVLHFAAFNKDQSIVSSFKHLEDIVDTQNDREITPFYYAYYNNNTEAAGNLLKNQCANKHIRLSNSKSLLHLAAIYGHTSTAQNLLINANNAKILVSVTDALGRTPLHYAVWLGDEQMVDLLLGKCASPNAVDKDGIPASHMAISLPEEKALAIIKQMTKWKLDVNLKGAHDNTLLHLFCALEYLTVVQHLLENGADVNAVNDGNSWDNPSVLNAPLLIASWLGNLELIDLLVKHGAQYYSDRPVYPIVATLKGKGTLKIVKYFEDNFPHETSNINNILYNIANSIQNLNLNNDIFLHFQSRDPKNTKFPYDIAKESANLFVIKYVFEDKDFSPDKTCGTILYDALACALISYDIVKYMIDTQKAELKTDKGCESLLHRALSYVKQPSVAELLVERGVESKTGFKDGTSELHLASKRGLNEIVNHLLINGFKDIINTKDANGKTPLFLAVDGEGNLELVKTLIDEGANFDGDSYGNTLLNAAAKRNKTNVAENFIFNNTEKIDPSLANKDGFTPLHYSAMNNNLYLITKLLKSGNVDINAETVDKTTPIYEAIKHHGEDMVIKQLLNKRAKIKHFDPAKCENLVSLAIEQNKFKIAEILISNNADIKTAGFSKKTPMYLAIEADNPKMVRMLLGKGADYNFSGPNGTTPIDLLLDNKSNTIKYFAYDYRNDKYQTMLHLMASQNKDKVVQTLLERGAYVNAQDKDGNSPLHLAAKNGHLETVKLMCEMKQKCINVALENVDKQTALDLARAGNKTSVVDFLEHWHPKQRARREIVEQFSEMPVSSSARRASWWVKDLVGSVVSTWGSTTNQACQSMLSHYYESHSSSAQSISSLSASVNVHSTLLLLDVLARKFTGQSYVGTDSQSDSPLEARSTSLVIVEQFERMLSRLAKETNSQLVSELDSFELYRTVEHCILSGKFKKIDRILLSTARDAFPYNLIDDSLLVMIVEELLNEVLLGKKDSSLVETSSTL